jgi:hypothetical protein
MKLRRQHQRRDIDARRRIINLDLKVCSQHRPNLRE